ncbi:MAG: insulinase family protein, partial [Pseudomonadota bacterium]
MATLLLAASGLQAQTPAERQQLQAAMTIGLDQQTPLSPLVHTGKFANGLTYYIRENAEPRNRAELRLVVNAGSILEDEDQLGLAHFLEHMAFNGTENFEKQEITRFMESIGMRFGAEINASTSFDETIYKLTVPTNKPENVAKAFQILEDWATSMTLDIAEIEKERGVVIEEWRGRQGAAQRIQNQQLPVLLKNSRYADRLAIGTLESLQSFDVEALGRFYNDWYRPDLMSVVAVGDFKAADIEKLMREHFESIPAAENPRPRPVFDVPAQPDTQIVVATDPEVPTTQVAIQHKLPSNSDWSVGGYRQRIVERLFNVMLSTRFAEMARQPNPPFMGAASAYSPLVRPVSAYVLAAAVPETGINHGLEVLLAEAERVSNTGFTAAELDRNKMALLRASEQAYTNRASRPSSSHADEMIRAYLTGESIPGPEYEMAMTSRFVPTITLAEINAVGKKWISPVNRVVSVVAPAKEGLTPPTPEELTAVIANTANVELTAYEETTTDAPLVATPPQGSKVVATRELEGGITEWTLGNGIKVILKPTDFKQDELLFVGASPGGTSLVGDDDYIPATTAVTLIANGGVGTFNAIELGRKMTGKLASVSPFISEFEEGVQGRGSPADLETMLQLAYLRITAPRADAGFFDIFKEQTTEVLQNRTVNPGTALEDAFLVALYNNHPRRQPPSLDMINKANLDRSLAIYQDRLGDATDMTFIFVGTIDAAKMQPLVETWIGGLPTSGRKETWKDLGIRPATGAIDLTVNKGVEPKSSTRIVYNGPFNIRSMNDRTVLAATVSVLQNRLLDVMREQLGAT